MPTWLMLFVLLSALLAGSMALTVWRRARRHTAGPAHMGALPRQPGALPRQYALYAVSLSLAGALGALTLGALFSLPPTFAFMALLAVSGLVWWRVQAAVQQRAPVRLALERWLTWSMAGAAALAIATTVSIVLSLLAEAIQFFQLVPWTEFLFGLKWSPQMAIRADQVASSGAFGAVPLFAGTLLITLLAMGVALPLGLMAAIYLTEYASHRVEAVAKPLLEILAGIPTVVYGFFAALALAPFLRRSGEALGLTVASESALAAGLVMGVMILPFISSLSHDVLRAVPQSLRDGALALGATRSETIAQVVLPAAFGGIMGAVLLAVSRAIGETMIVVMAAGLAARLTANPLDAVTTITVQMVGLLVGDQEFDSPKTLAAFALGLTLFFLTLALNLTALWAARRFREQYD